MRVNVLPSPTWRWLKVNYADVDIKEGAIKSEEYEIKDKTSLFLSLSDEIKQDGLALNIRGISGCDANLLIDCNDIKKESFKLDVSIELLESAKLKVFLVFRKNENSIRVNNLRALLLKDARLDVSQIILGCGKNYTEIIANLEGNRSECNINSAYLLHDKNLSDMNYVVNHYGKESTSDIKVLGVLYKGAEKIYRGTIDFKRGCKASVGNETEDVLLMDSDVINKSVPVILCQEEDVEGNHGATIGKLSKELMFYLRSRGIDEENIYEMMARARMESAIDNIPDDNFKEELSEYLKNSL